MLVVVALLGGGLAPCARARQTRSEPVFINFGQPNIWSLEQAHYLLARMRARSIGLKTKDLGDLDPNATHGTRLDVLKTLISGGVGFSQGVGLNNELFENNSRFGLQRRQELLGRRDVLQSQLRDVTVRLADLKVERAGMAGAAFTDAQRAQKDAEITETTSVKDLLTSDINATTTEINGLPAAPTAAQTPEIPQPTPSAISSVTDKLLEDDDFRKNLSGNAKLNATTMLDNDVNLQYEIIAKQLTLLRDEVGPGQRLVFLELPQTFYTVPDKSNRKVAQVWWRIDGYGKRDEGSPARTAAATATPTPTPFCGVDPYAWRRAVEHNPYRPPDALRTQRDILSDEKIKQQPLNVRRLDDGRYQDRYGDSKVPAESEARALDLIPRQSALNVNDIQDRQKNFNFAGLFTLLSGFGARVGYERQRRLYEQFIGQEIYASAFGKGLTEFGWTFGALPGTERIATGLHTTYAVVLVPSDAQTITLKARGCHFPRKNYSPQSFAAAGSTPPEGVTCMAEKEFKMVVPGTSENNFWVTGVDFRSVKPGETAVVHVHGEYFSPQIGVLVDGKPLRREIGLAQIELALTRRSDESVFAPPGGFEFVNSKELVLAFTKDANYRGTPSIILVTPGRSIEINRLRLVINDSYKEEPKGGESCYRADGDHRTYVRLDEYKDKMFSPDVALGVTGLDVVNFDAAAGVVTAQLTGSGFGRNKNNVEVRVNGAKGEVLDVFTPGVMLVRFTPPARDTWNVTVVQGKDDERISTTFPTPNPMALKVTRAEVIRYEAAVKDKPDKPGFLQARLQGTGFNSSLIVTARRADGPAPLTYTVVSPSEIIVDIKAPGEIEVLNLKDSNTGASAGTTIVRP
jgi:hypothetical protein